MSNVAGFELSELVRAVRPLERALREVEMAGGEQPKSLPVLTDVIEDVVLAVRNLAQVREPQGSPNPDALTRLALAMEETNPGERSEALRSQRLGAGPGLSLDCRSDGVECGGTVGEQFAGRS